MSSIIVRNKILIFSNKFQCVELKTLHRNYSIRNFKKVLTYASLYNLHTIENNLCTVRKKEVHHDLKKINYSTITNGDQHTYDQFYKRSLEDPETFWSEISKNIHWFEPFEKVLDNSNPPFTKWFVGGKLNTCYNAVDRHVSSGLGSKLAVIHDSPITNSISKFTFSELLEKVSRLAGLLSSLGVKKGDSVVIYMPMIPETLFAMLAIARLGAVHLLVFGGFEASELAVRISHCEAKVILSTSYGLEPGKTVHYKPILDKAIDMATTKPKHCVIFQRNELEKSSMVSPRDVDWTEGVSTAKPHDAVPVDSDDPLYVLYTSGTTGAPKGIVRPNGGHCVLLPWTMKMLYGMDKEDVWWTASDFGWIVGHSYICYAPLLNGNTTIIYEGKPVGTPDAGQFFRVLLEHNVKGLFLAPTTIRAISREDPTGIFRKKYKHNLRYLFVAGELLDHETRLWAEDAFGCPVLDHWWQTETGAAITAHSMGLGMERNPPRGTTGKPFIGHSIKILDSDGNELPRGEMGRIVSKLPLPPGCMTTLLNADERFVETYFKKFPGYYDTMDAGIMDDEGYIKIQARVDDVINVAGHRLSTMSLEEAMLNHPDIIEAAVIGVPDNLKGEVPFGFFVLSKNCEKDENVIKKEIVNLVRNIVGPVASFKLCAEVQALPKTRSSKIPRKTFAKLARDEQITISSAIEDPSTYDCILKKHFDLVDLLKKHQIQYVKVNIDLP